MRDYLFNTGKIHYVLGDKPDVECILCAVRDRKPDIKNLEITRTKDFIITVNLYPFNPGHVMVFPRRHVTDLASLTDEEALTLHRLTVRVMSIIQSEFSPSGFNVGYNIGNASGASIKHLHQHIVPRYKNEIGFLDVLSNTRVIVVDPVEVMERIRKGFHE